MHRKHFSQGFRRGQGRRGRGRGGRGFGPGWSQEEDWTMGARGWGFGPDFGPPPWAPRWGWSQESPEEGEVAAPPWGRGPWWGAGREISDAEQRSWLQAQKARLQAWREHLDARLAEIDAALKNEESK